MVSLHHDGVGRHRRARGSALRDFAEQHPFNWRMLVGLAGVTAFWASVIAMAPRFL